MFPVGRMPHLCLNLDQIPAFASLIDQRPLVMELHQGLA